MDDDVMLTTVDNPINPFVDFIGWWKYDMFVLGYDTCGSLARQAATSSLFSDEENAAAEERAMDYLVESEPLIYRKVHRSDYPVKSVAY